MADPDPKYPTDIHGPADAAPPTTGLYCRCRCCGAQWQLQSFAGTDAKGCKCCGADERAVHIVEE